MSGPRIYVSGSIQLLPLKEAKANFTKACELLEAAGYDSLNPFDIPAVCPPSTEHFGEDGEENNHEWECWMRGDLIAMLQCYGVAMLPGWERSRGARTEHFTALQVGMPVRMLEDW